MSNAPCRGCTTRHPGCHGRCEAYRAVCEKTANLKEARAAYFFAQSIVVESVYRTTGKKAAER